MTFRTVIFASILFFIGLRTSLAQPENEPPSGQFGAGIYLFSNYLPTGFEFTYAPDSTSQIGSMLYLSVSNNVVGYHIAPYYRFMVPWIVSPFAEGGVQLYSPGTGTQVGFFLGGGVAYCINHHINIHGDVDVLNLFFSPGTTDWLVFRIGADWFF